MKSFTFIAGFIFAALVAIPAFGQAPAGATKIGWIDTGGFAAEKGGIVKYVKAYKDLGNEVRPRTAELEGIQAKLKTISDDLTRVQNSPANVPINQSAAIAKQDEGKRLQREFEFKKKEYDAFIEKRGGEILGPINQDIGKAIQEFAKARGYSVILDLDKLGQAGAVLALDQSANITNEFITYYNARPAGTAAAATPR